MKYLKKFNEELKPDVYSSAAKKLKKLGHPSRAEKLEDWTKITKWKKNIQEYSQFGVFDMDIFVAKYQEKEKKVFSGQFYLYVGFDETPYLENLEDDPNYNKIVFQIGAIPVDEKTYRTIESMSMKNSANFISHDLELHNGFLWTNFIEFNISTNEVSIDQLNDVKGMFNNRKSAVKFKNLIKEMFGGMRYPSGVTDKDTMKDHLMHSICDEGNKPIEYIDEIINSINKVNVNTLYKESI